MPQPRKFEVYQVKAAAVLSKVVEFFGHFTVQDFFFQIYSVGVGTFESEYIVYFHEIL